MTEAEYDAARADLNALYGNTVNEMVARRDQSLGTGGKSGDDVYTLMGWENLHPFIQWIGELFTIKTPELKRVPIVAAMYTTFDANEDDAKKFARG